MNSRACAALLLALCGTLVGPVRAVSAQTPAPAAAGAAADPAEADFELLRVAARPLDVSSPPGTTKTSAEFARDQKMQSAAFVAASKQAEAFIAKYPKHARVSEAKKIQVISLLRAANTGTVSVEPQAMRLAREYRADLSNASRDRYHVAVTVLQRQMLLKPIKDKAKLMQTYHDRAMDLYGEFPNEPAVFDLLLGVARNADPVLARSTANQLLTMPAPDGVKSEAQAVIDRLDLPGKAVNFEWQDEDGTTHKSSDFKGKTIVFLVWGTFAHSSAAAQDAVGAVAGPNVEIVSVNVDTDTVKGKAAKAKFADLAYFDARGLQSPLATELRAWRVPAVHVVSPNGVYVGTGPAGDLNQLLAQAATE